MRRVLLLCEVGQGGWVEQVASCRNADKSADLFDGLAEHLIPNITTGSGDCLPIAWQRCEIAYPWIPLPRTTSQQEDTNAQPALDVLVQETRKLDLPKEVGRQCLGAKEQEC